MNDMGTNLAQVLDDCQMSYMNNEEYIRFSRTEEYTKELKAGTFDLTQVMVRQASDTDFDEYWGNGLVMNWTPIALEEQKTHINWRQSIQDDGSGMSRLATWVSNDIAGFVGVPSATNNVEKANIYIENKKDMDSKASNSALSAWIKAGSDFVKNKDDEAKELYINEENAIKQAVGSGTDIDAMAVCAAALAKNTKDYASIVKEYRQVQTALNCSNPAMIWTAMATDVQLMKMYIDGTLEAYVNPPQQNNSNGTNTTTAAVAPKVTTIPEPQWVEHPEMSESTRHAMNGVKYITIHQSVSGNDWPPSSFYSTSMSKNNGRGGKGEDYHAFITKYGGKWQLHRGTPEEYEGGHTGKHHEHNLGICVAGLYDDKPENGIPTTPVEEESINLLISAIAYWCNKYNIEPSENTIKGHYTWYNESESDRRGAGCPGTRLQARIPDIIKAVQGGSVSSATKANDMWSAFAELMSKGLEKKGTKTSEGLGFFPQICYLYVQLQAASAISSNEGSEWGFPFADEDIKSWDKKYVLLTSKFGTEERGRLHQGTDLVPGDDAKSKDIPFRAVKDGVVHLYNGWSNMNGITVYHSADKTWSRYLHAKKILVTEGQTVKKGDKLGYVGGQGANGASTYAVHLHIEFGQNATAEGNENITLQNGIAATDKWPQPEANVEGSYSGWKVS